MQNVQVNSIGILSIVAQVEIGIVQIILLRIEVRVQVIGLHCISLESDKPTT